MKKPFLKPNQSLFALLVFAIALLCAQTAHAQPCEGALNPPNPPMCQPPGNVFKVLLVLDESGSIAFPPGFEDEVETAVDSFAAILNRKTPAAGRMQMGIVEFSTNASTPVPMIDVKASNFISTVKNYLYNFDGSGGNPNYQPSGSTDYQDTLTEAASVAAAARVNIIFFITDGNPDTQVNTWIAKSNAIKNAGTYIFGIAIGTNINTCNITALSGLDKLGMPLSIQNGADWTQTNFDLLAQDLADFANSLIDVTAPTITCPANVRVNNDLGKCGQSVVYNTEVSDDCPSVNLVCTPPPGSFFPVGQTIVTCKATDNVGNSASCTFKVTVLDMEAPKITCPFNKIISCEESALPANTGSPSTSDNCAIGGVSNTDVRVDGTCVNEFTLNRTWTAVDVHGNASTCLQVIAVEDKKSPFITCPANVTVTCDTTVAKTGLATATDNCDPSVSISRRDIHISGDCEWFCITERHWTATDDCRNTSKCVQVITKDVTPLIETALGAGPLVWGQTASTVTLPVGKGACVVKWLPYSGVLPTPLKFDDAVADASCRLMSNPLDAAGRIVNPMLGEAMKLKILVRLNPSLGTKRLKADLNCDMHFIVRQALAGGENATVNELLRVTDLTLGNVNVNLAIPESAMHLLNVLKCVNAGRSVCNP